MAKYVFFLENTWNNFDKHYEVQMAIYSWLSLAILTFLANDSEL